MRNFSLFVCLFVCLFVMTAVANAEIMSYDWGTAYYNVDRAAYVELGGPDYAFTSIYDVVKTNANKDPNSIDSFSFTVDPGNQTGGTFATQMTGNSGFKTTGIDANGALTFAHNTAHDYTLKFDPMTIITQIAFDIFAHDAGTPGLGMYVSLMQVVDGVFTGAAQTIDVIQYYVATPKANSTFYGVTAAEGWAISSVFLTVDVLQANVNGGIGMGYAYIGSMPGSVSPAPSASTPEPATFVMFGLGLCGLGLARRFGRK